MEDIERVRNYQLYVSRLLAQTDKRVLEATAGLLALHIAYCHQKFEAIALEEGLDALTNPERIEDAAEQLVEAMEMLTAFLDAASSQ